MLRSNPQIELASRFLSETGANIFLTGKAGTGKTTFLREAVSSINKRLVVCAPTGVAAINARGVTLHSLFQLPFGVITPEMLRGDILLGRKIRSTKLALLRSIELLIIDEISMVRCDVLDGIDSILRRVRRSTKPFGGVQLLMIGDVCQLSPICQDDEWDTLRQSYSSPYFFESAALKECNYQTIELKEIFRQSDREFTELLNSVRSGVLSDDVVAKINTRYIPNFEPPEGFVTLSTHNYSVNNINEQKLHLLKEESHFFTADIKGDYSESAYPNDKTLELKVGAQVIFVKNDISTEKLYYNGMLGKITAITDGEVTVQTSDSEIVVSKVAWENIEYSINDKDGRIEENIKGVFMQIPLRCAWAITIHKSQGLTFDNVVIDAGHSFAYGQVYVALSRCRTFEGVVLRTPLHRGVVINDRVVDAFCVRSANSTPTAEDLESCRRAYYGDILCEIFSFEELSRLVDSAFTLFERVMPYNEGEELSSLLREFNWRVEKEMVSVGVSFQQQLRSAVEVSENFAADSFIDERLKKAAGYYAPLLKELRELFDRAQKEAKTDNKENKKRLNRLTEDLQMALQVKEIAIDLCGEGYELQEYLRRKYVVITAAGTSSKAAKEKKSPKLTSNIVIDMIHNELYCQLIEWRKEECIKESMPFYTIANNRTFQEIQFFLPTNNVELMAINGIGSAKVEKYGAAILAMVSDYIFSVGLDMAAHRKYVAEYLSSQPSKESPTKSKLLILPNAETTNVQCAKTINPKYLLTYNLYKEGHSIESIAEQQGYTVGTIYSHIGRLIGEGMFNLEEFVEPSRIAAIESAVKIVGSIAALKPIREELGDEYSYDEIRLVISKI